MYIFRKSFGTNSQEWVSNAGAAGGTHGSVTPLPALLGEPRGEYFYSVGVKQLQVIFFSSCRNIQFGVFCAEIFILWCIVKKY